MGLRLATSGVLALITELLGVGVARRVIARQLVSPGSVSPVRYQHSRQLVNALNRCGDPLADMPEGWEKKLNREGKVREEVEGGGWEGGSGGRGVGRREWGRLWMTNVHFKRKWWAVCMYTCTHAHTGILHWPRQSSNDIHWSSPPSAWPRTDLHAEWTESALRTEGAELWRGTDTYTTTFGGGAQVSSIDWPCSQTLPKRPNLNLACCVMICLAFTPPSLPPSLSLSLALSLPHQPAIRPHHQTTVTRQTAPSPPPSATPAAPATPAGKPMRHNVCVCVCVCVHACVCDYMCMYMYVLLRQIPWTFWYRGLL